MKNPEHRVRTTKKRLRDALTALLSEKPLRSITVKELCERAELNRGTFYAHYADVFDLMEQIEAEIEAEFVAALNPSAADIAEPRPSLHVTKSVFACLEKNADFCRVTLGPNGDQAFAYRLIQAGRTRYMESCKRAYPNVSQARIDLYYTFIIGGCISMISCALQNGGEEGLSALAADTERIMLQGIGFLQEER